MAWEARSGLKPLNPPRRTTIAKRRNGLGSPFGFETTKANLVFPLKELWRNGLGSPFGFETDLCLMTDCPCFGGEMAWEARSGLKLGQTVRFELFGQMAKWPGKPVR